MTKIKEELIQSKTEYNKSNAKLKELSDDEMENVSAGTDTDSLKKTGKTVPLPEAKYKKESDGGYAGKTIPESNEPNVY